MKKQMDNAKYLIYLIDTFEEESGPVTDLILMSEKGIRRISFKNEQEYPK